MHQVRQCPVSFYLYSFSLLVITSYQDYDEDLYSARRKIVNCQATVTGRIFQLGKLSPKGLNVNSPGFLTGEKQPLSTTTLKGLNGKKLLQKRLYFSLVMVSFPDVYSTPS